MKHFLIGVSAVALLVACGDEKTSADEVKDIAGGAVAAAAQSLEISDISLPKLKFKAQDYGQTAEALAALKLDGKSNEIISFEDVKTSGGGAVFSGLTISTQKDTEDGEALAFIAEKLSLDGLQMTDAGATFDRLVLSNVSIDDQEEGIKLNIGDISIVEPNEAAATFFASLLKGEKPEGTANFSEWAFDQMKLENLSMVGDDQDKGAFNVSVGQMALASMADAITGQALLSDLKVDFDFPSEDGPGGMPIKGSLNFDKFAMSNLKTSLFDDLPDFDEGPDAIAEMNAQMMENYTSPIDQGFDQASMKGLSALSG
jgi:hypothetical protein